MKIFKTLAVGILALSLCAAASATDVTGLWKGKLHLDFSKLPKAKNAEQHKRFDQVKQMAAKIGITFNLKSNHTYVATVTAAGKQKVDHGTWKLSGNTITMLSTDDKPSERKPETVTVSKDGRTLWTALPGASGSTATFTRG